MANKSVLDFLAVTSTDPADVLYIIRGTGAGRDKKITWANLTANLLDKTITTPQSVAGSVTFNATGSTPLVAVQTDAGTSNTVTGLVIRHTSTASAADGLGVQIIAQMLDDSLVISNLGALVFKRDGANNSGKFALQLTNAGALADRFTVDKTGAGVFTGSLTAGALGTFTVSDTATNTVVTSMLLKHKTTADMAANFGVALAFVINDSANVDNQIGLVRCVRNSADNDARMELVTKTAGADNTQFTVNASGTCSQRANPATNQFSTDLATTQFVGRPTGAVIDITTTTDVSPEHGRVYNMNQATPYNMTMTLTNTPTLGTVCYVLAYPNTQTLRVLDAMTGSFTLITVSPVAEGPSMVTCTRWKDGWLVQGA